jgi:two-component system LytT family sensor kinase
MKKSIVILLHVGFWACYLILIAIILAVYSKSGANLSNQSARVMNAFYSITLFALVPSFITFYLFYFLLFPKYLQRNKYFLSVIYGVLIAIAAAIIGYILIRYFIET